MNRFIALTIAASLCAAALTAGDIGIADADPATGGWLLLENPLGQGGEGHGEYSGDPGLPVLSWASYPGGNWPATELWRYDAKTFKYSQATHVLGGAEGDSERPNLRRTLYSPFLVGSQPYVIHYDYKDKEGQCRIIKVTPELANAGGKLPASAIVFTSKQFIDAPIVSPGGEYVLMRVFEGNEESRLVVLGTSDWKQVAATEPDVFARPAWWSTTKFCAVRYQGVEKLPRAGSSATKGEVAGFELKKGEAGLVLAGPTKLASGLFPQDSRERQLVADPARGLIAYASFNAKGKLHLSCIVPGTKGFETFNPHAEPGKLLSLDYNGKEITFAQAHDQSLTLSFIGERGVDRREAASELSGLGADGVTSVNVGSSFAVDSIWLANASTHPWSTIQGLGGGVTVVLEAVANPAHELQPKFEPEFLYSLVVPKWPGCDSMRNPRVLQRISPQVGRFKEIEEMSSLGITSTLLVFRLDVKAAADKIKNKKATFIELYDARGRGGNGRIRVHDDMSTNWLVNSIHGEGTEDTDHVYDCANLKNGVMTKTAANASATYDDLVAQLEARKMLMLGGAANSWETGGMRFIGREVFEDAINGGKKRVYVYARRGRKIAEGRYERVILRFLADPPPKAKRLIPGSSARRCSDPGAPGPA